MIESDIDARGGLGKVYLRSDVEANMRKRMTVCDKRSLSFLLNSLVATTTLAASVKRAARRARERTADRGLLAPDRSADARAECCAAGDRADGARASLKTTPRGLAVERIKSRAARADSRALLPAKESARDRAAADDGRRARFTTET